MNIRIAIPTSSGRLHGHFGGAREFTLVDADQQLGIVINRQVVAAPPHQPGQFPRWLHEKGVQVVLASGIGEPALKLFIKHGIKVRAAWPETLVEVATAAYLTGALMQTPEGCAHNDSHHHPDHGHDH